MKEEMQVTTENVEVIDEYVVNFAEPYLFEGEEYKSIDLRCLNNITGSDMVAVDRIMQRNGSTAFMNEMTSEYAMQIASRMTKKPIEFFDQLPGREVIKVRNRVVRFLFSQA